MTTCLSQCPNAMQRICPDTPRGALYDQADVLNRKLNCIFQLAM